MNVSLLYRGSNHATKSSLHGLGTDFQAPFMNTNNDSTRTTFGLSSSNFQGEDDPIVTTQCKGPMRRETGSTYCLSDSDNDDESQSSFDGDVSDVSRTSFIIEEDDDLDELEKELERFALRGEKQVAKKAQKQASYILRQQQEQADVGRRRKSMEERKRPTEGVRSVRRTLSSGSSRTKRTDAATANQAARRASRRGSNKGLQVDDNRSVGSNKSLQCSSLNGPNKANEGSNHSSIGKTWNSKSNRSLKSMCPVKEQLFNVFGPMSTSCLAETYFPPVEDKDINAMPDRVERAIRSKKLERLQRLHKQGHSMTARNKQGESVVSLVCRAGSAEMLMYLVTEAKASVRVKDHVGKTPLHEMAWNPTFYPSIAMMLLSDSPELLWVPDARGFLALDYAPKRAQVDWYEFLEAKQPMIKLALQFSQFKATSMELNQNQERLRQILEHRLESQAKQESQQSR